MLISQNSLYKCAILVFYATVVTYSISIYSLIKHMTHYIVYMLQYIIIVCNRIHDHRAVLHKHDQ